MVEPGRAIAFPSLQFWPVFVYTISAPDYEECCDAGSSVARWIRPLAKELSIKSWEDPAACLCVFPWVSAFHDEPGKKLWTAVHTNVAERES